MDGQDIRSDILALSIVIILAQVVKSTITSKLPITSSLKVAPVLPS